MSGFKPPDPRTIGEAMKMRSSMELMGKTAGLAALIIAFYVSISLVLWEINESGFRDPAVFFWSGFLLIIAFAGAAGGVKNRPKTVWASGLILTLFSILAMFSIGNATLPIAILLLISASLLTMGSMMDRNSTDRT
ncbi:MAG: hypothetical protein D6733_04010 [Methanobacteriota archaeon]|nr:MAG: hypothetical protein D6733_04010 [Euryarchaeota archaeon]